MQSAFSNFLLTFFDHFFYFNFLISCFCGRKEVGHIISGVEGLGIAVLESKSQMHLRVARPYRANCGPAARL